ncbi:Protein argonaute [Cryptotrichosporon argae]
MAPRLLLAPGALGDIGKAGKTIDVEANVCRVRQSATLIIHYRLGIKRVVKTASDKMPKELARKIWNQAVRENANGPLKAPLDSSAFDGLENVYMSVKLPLDSDGKKELTVALPEPGRELDDRSRFKVTLKVANEIDPQRFVRFCRGERQSTQELELVAMNILFREDPTARFTPEGARGHFFGLDDQVPISGGGVVGKGFIQSFRPTSSGLPAIQFDTAYTAFFKAGPALDIMVEVLGVGAVYAALQKIDRQFTSKKPTSKPASDIKFRLEGKDGKPDRDVGIEQYYRKQYNIAITKPRLPCVIYGKNFMVPLELVVLANVNSIPFTSLTSDQVADMIRVAVPRPPKRCATIKQWRKTLDYDGLPKLNSWGVQVHPNILSVKARVLPAPRITYNRGKQLSVLNGGWNLRGVAFTKPGAPLKSWSVVSFDQRCDARAFGTFPQDADSHAETITA